MKHIKRLLAGLVFVLLLTVSAYAETGSFSILGKSYSYNITRLDLSGISAREDIDTFVAAAPRLKRLKTVVLGDEKTAPVPWETIKKLEDAAPDARFLYDFSLYGVAMNLQTAYMDLRRISVSDNAEKLMATLPCMQGCKKLDLDNCGLSEERIFQIRDAFPEIRVIWRVTFSTGYSVRTDAKTILASYVGDGGLTDEESCRPLTYCTDVVNLDLGHNNHMQTVDFVRNMPDLEVLIIAKDDVTDISAIAECKKLRYLELYMNPGITDLSPLSGLTELRDLEIGLLNNLTDMSPIYSLDLDRLWIGTETPIPQEQIAEYQRLHPDCVINLTDDDVDNTWRYMEVHGGEAPNVLWPQYRELRDIFRYGHDDAWSYPGNDPYYYMAPGAIPHEESAAPEAALFDMETFRYSPDDDFIDLSGMSSSDVTGVFSALRQMKNLEAVELGSDEITRLSWGDIRALRQATPDAEFFYSFTLYGKTFTLSDTEMDLNHIPIEDQGALVREVIACMPSLRYLDMDFCGVDDEHMAAIRDDFPQVKVVWRVWFGGAYSVRTDVEKILASCPGAAGNLTKDNIGSLKYCTDVKYLDIGHNEILKDVSFVAYMPKLEVGIFAMLNVEDISPLANCKNLEFLEIQTNKITDLSPLKELTNLHHLNIGYNFELTDITPLYGLTNLERLWIGRFTPIPEEQVAEMQKRVPDCVIDVTCSDPHDGWRFGSERYDLLVQQFGYDTGAYSFRWLDPLYDPHD